jgi:hypothetical protein
LWTSGHVLASTIWNELETQMVLRACRTCTTEKIIFFFNLTIPLDPAGIKRGSRGS